MKEVYNLSKVLELPQIFHYYSKVKNLPANYLVAFEDIFNTRIWDTKQELFFTHHTPKPVAHYEANFEDKILRGHSHASIRGATTCS